jgi:hypothetical protein
MIGHKITIGVVTHPKSPNPEWVWRESMKSFSKHFKGAGLIVAETKCAENKFPKIRISLLHLWRSKFANLLLSLRWHNFELRNTSLLGLTKLILGSSKVFTIFLVKTLTSRNFRNQEKKTFKRSINICLAHISIFEESFQRNDNYLLILEDDARFENQGRILEDLDHFIKLSFSQTTIPAFVNLSKSLSWKQLQLAEMYDSKKFLDITPNIYLPSQMFHNTTCANLYNSQYISKFSCDWRSQIEKYVWLGIPFDWIINALISSLPTNELLTFHLHQPLVIQGSMHPLE